MEHHPSCRSWVHSTLWSLLLLIFRVNAQIRAQLTRCPTDCSAAGPDPSAWTYYHDLNALANCNATVLFDLNIHNSIGDSRTHLTFRACTGSGAQSDYIDDHTGEIAKRQYLSLNGTAGSTTVHIARWGDATSSSVAAAAASSAASQLSSFLQSNAVHASNLFAKSGNVVAGLHVGSQVQTNSAVTAIQKFVGSLSGQSSLSERFAVQACGSDNQTIGPQVFGLVVDTTGDTAAVQNVLKEWSNAKCVHGSSSNELLSDINISLIPGTSVSVLPRSLDETLESRSLLFSRATCSYIQAQSGDGCYSLAQRCGITQTQLESYNGGASFCNSIQVGQYVCCSSGSLPNFAPQPSANGSCYPYTVKSGDTCSAIAQSYQTTATSIENNNNQTWGWMGCADLLIGMKICLSSGNPPFPANVPNAVCGPQINGTATPSTPSSWSGLNPCPLNACCDIWGQCGITSEFCTPDPADTGAPGTAQPGSNGCISNCGTQIVTGPAVSNYARVGYYEAFNGARPCLHMSPSSIPSYYTHVHFAFANITSSYTVDLGSYADLFQKFLDQSGFKKIVSFGGWGFSTSPQTYPIFRQGVTAAAREDFARNVANFVQSYSLQGVDFDWEYPGAPDIPGIPPGSAEDGANYLEFLKILRGLLPSSYSLSIAAPASYWYLKGFPIANISQIVDYIVYMTYDMHGQWDYGNDYTDPGCPAGNCLRSQTNHTETEQSFSMVTKAGVPISKLMLGQPLYGRSFQMTAAGCYTDMCTYTGPSSGALPGRCTGTPGYIANWEIEQIINNSTYTVEQYNSEVAGDILVYDSTQWVSWMRQSTYNSRSSWAQSLGFGGTSDWAMDLNQSYTDTGTPIGGGSGVVYIPPSIYTQSSPTIACIPPCTFVFPPWTLSSATTISQPASTLTVEDIWPSVSTIIGGGTTTVYVSKTTVTTIVVPPVTTNVISVWNVEWTDTSEQIIYLTSSLIFPAFTLTEGSDVVKTTIASKTTTSTTTLAGIIYTYSPGPYPPVTGPNPTGGGGTQPTTPIPPPPPPGSLASVHVSRGPPNPTCFPGEIGCGSLCKSNCLPQIPCIGICGCIGLGCPGGGGCIGPGCNGGGGSSGGGNEGSNTQTTTCATSSTVTDCQVDCSVTNFGDNSYNTKCYQTSCSVTVTCATTGTTTTSEITTALCPTTFLPTSTWSPANPNSPLPTLGSNNAYTAAGVTQPPSCTNYDADPDQGVTSGYCVCSGSTFSQSVNTQTSPANSCAYTALPTKTIPAPIQTITSTQSSICSVCTYVGQSASCTSINSCTAKTTPPPTSATPYPTNTAVNVGSAYCYTSSNGNYVSFTQGDAQNVVAAFCNNNYVLGPGNTFGYVEGYQANGYTVIAAASWAPNQNGCGTEQNFPFNQNSIQCLDGWSTDFFCTNEDGSQTTSYGGGYVLEPPGSRGCILIELFAHSGSGSKKARGLSHNQERPAHVNITTNLGFNASNFHTGYPSAWLASNNTGGEVRKARLFDAAAIAQLLRNTSSTTSSGS